MTAPDLQFTEEELRELPRHELVDLYVGLREVCARRDEELRALWTYADWEALSTVKSNASPSDANPQFAVHVFHAIMVNEYETWPHYLAARMLRRGRIGSAAPEATRDAWYGEETA